MRAGRLPVVALWCIASGCLGGDQPVEDGSSAAGSAANQGFPVVILEPSQLLLDCASDEAADAYVSFDCDSATVYACRGVTKAVVQYEDGARQRFVRAPGQMSTFAAHGRHDGKRIASIWVELGGDAQGAGPHRGSRFGQRFDAPEDSCAARSARAEPPARAGDPARG